MEDEAIRWKAEHGVIPGWVLCRLIPSQFKRISDLTQNAAKRMLRAVP